MVFAHEEYQNTLKALSDQLRDGLSINSENEGLQPDEIVRRIKALRECHTVDAEPRRTGTAVMRAPEPVTARIRRKDEERFNPAFAAPGDEQPVRSYQEQEAGPLAVKIQEAGQAF